MGLNLHCDLSFGSHDSLVTPGRDCYRLWKPGTALFQPTRLNFPLLALADYHNVKNGKRRQGKGMLRDLDPHAILLICCVFIVSRLTLACIWVRVSKTLTYLFTDFFFSLSLLFHFFLLIQPLCVQSSLQQTLAGRSQVARSYRYTQMMSARDGWFLKADFSSAD